MTVALGNMADACKHADDSGASYVCDAVANLIAGSGPVGSTKQAHMIHAAQGWGFLVEIYPGSIRVQAPPKA